MPVACTFSAISLVGTITATAANADFSMFIVKNGVTTAMGASITVTTLGVAVQSTSTANPVSVVAGDTVALQFTSSNGVPAVSIVTAVSCR
jgi:hypothetical protein